MFELTPFVHGNHLRTYDPFREMDELRNQFFGGTANGMAGIRTDIQDKGDHYLMEADLPGFKKDEINLELHEGYLTVSAAKGLDQEENDKKGKLIRQERYEGAMQRSFYVGEELTEEDIKASFQHGVLSLNLPKKEKKAVPEKKTIMIEG